MDFLKQKAYHAKERLIFQLAKLTYYQEGNNSLFTEFIKVEDPYISEASKRRIWVEGEVDGEDVEVVYEGKFNYKSRKAFLNSKITGFKNYNSDGIQFYLNDISVAVHQNDRALESDEYYKKLVKSVFEGKDKIIGSAGRDVLWGYAGKDTLVGGSGMDSIYGGTGKDVLYGDKGDDRLEGGEGKDKLFGGDGNDDLRGGNGADKLYGGDGDDYFIGGDGNDKLNGESGDDTLFGASGKDKLYGGNGNDLLVGADGDDYLTGGSGNDDLEGGDGDDYLIGGDGDDFVFGQYGNDKLEGGSGDDILGGWEGNDELFGGDGNDYLRGDKGVDKLYGGSGNDIFKLTDEGPDFDKIMDFKKGEDQIHIGVGFDFSQVAGFERGKHLEIYSNQEKSDLLAIVYNQNLDGGSLSEFIFRG